MPQIEFSTFNTDNAKYFKPVLAKSVQPDWWKQMKTHQDVRGVKTQTLRSCPAMDDWLKSGYYILANRDINVRFVTGHDDTEGMECYVEGDDFATASPSHPSMQFEHSFAYFDDGGPVKDAFKLRLGWNITLPAGYSAMYLDPFLFQNRNFGVWQGIIDADTFTTNTDTTQCILYAKSRKDFTIKKGTPIVQVLPYKREEWTASYQLYKHETFFKNQSQHTKEKVDFTEEEIETIGLKDWQKDGIQMSMPEQNRKPDSQTNGAKFGPYRTEGYWHEKGRYFRQENPPPECPFHRKEEDDDRQMELPLE